MIKYNYINVYIFRHTKIDNILILFENPKTNSQSNIFLTKKSKINKIIFISLFYCCHRFVARNEKSEVI